jgi:endonuclease/exonuclease/phosphatase family metal-dependent hydrolase
MHELACFRVATLNILHDPPKLSWPDRAPLVAEGFRTLDADIILLQEVAWPNEQASDLAETLSLGVASQLSVVITPLITPHGWQEGLALLTRYPVLEYAALRYPRAEQFCQRVRVGIGGGAVDIYNVHLDPYSADRRRTQVMLILRCMRAHEEAAGIVLGGDLNATPESDEIRPLRGSLQSAHVTAHGHEPSGTYPTPFRREPEIPGRTIDYLWHSATLSVRACSLTFNQPDARDPLLVASDHFGLVADLCLAPSIGEV